MIKKLAKSLREYKKPMYYTFVLMVCEVVIEILIPFITAKMVNYIKSGSDISYILKMGGLLIVLALVSLSCGALGSVTCSRASAGFAKNLRHDLFERVQQFSFENIDHFSTSSLVTRMTTDVSNVQMSYMMIIRTAVRAPLMLVFAAIMAFIMGGSMALCFVVVIPILAVGLFVIAKFAMPAFHRVFRKYDRLNESIEENVLAMRVVKGFAREGYEKEKFNRASEDIRKDFTFAERLVAINNPLMTLCMNFNFVFVMAFGSKMAISSQGARLDVGQISALITYGVQALISLLMISFIYVMLTMSAESAKRICQVLDEGSTITQKQDAVREVKDGSIEFKDVCFRYSEHAQEYALSHINLRIESGMTVGIIGGTGSSKSTMVQLIPRLYDVTSGSLEVAGVDVRDYDLEVLRDSVAMVLQKNQLFSGTILENLRWGNPDASFEDCVEACKLAQADEFIVQLPGQYETMIEQGGTNVSGGQRQRLCIARALLKRPKILILDDSTSAVDTRTDALIRSGFRSFIPETTKLIIAQRISSVQDADMILVLDKGHIVGAGTHEELLVTNEIYREVYEEQTRGEEDDE